MQLNGQSWMSDAAYPPHPDPSPVIVLVDTEESLDREAAASAFDGASFVHFRTASAFLEHMPRGDATCIIAAVDLPDMNGLDFIRTLRAGDDHTPVILVARDCCVHTAVEAVKAGACDCVERPTHPGQLLERVRQVVTGSS